MTTVIQNPILFDTTVDKNIDFGLRIRGKTKEERKRIVDDCLKMVRLDGFQRRKAKELFLVTHDTHQAYRLADEVINLFEGRVVQSSLENLFRGTVTKANDLSIFDTGKMKIEVVTDREGIVYAAIDPRDIVISIQPLSSSARNSFYGKINKIFDDGSSIRLSIGAGEELKVKITKESFAEMKLSIGSKVYLTFKSTAVEVF